MRQENNEMGFASSGAEIQGCQGQRSRVSEDWKWGAAVGSGSQKSWLVFQGWWMWEARRALGVWEGRCSKGSCGTGAPLSWLCWTPAIRPCPVCPALLPWPSSGGSSKPAPPAKPKHTMVSPALRFPHCSFPGSWERCLGCGLAQGNAHHLWTSVELSFWWLGEESQHIVSWSEPAGSLSPALKGMVHMGLTHSLGVICALTSWADLFIFHKMKKIHSKVSEALENFSLCSGLSTKAESSASIWPGWLFNSC